jgi:hypothetical protein
MRRLRKVAAGLDDSKAAEFEFAVIAELCTAFHVNFSDAIHSALKAENFPDIAWCGLHRRFYSIAVYSQFNPNSTQRERKYATVRMSRTNPRHPYSSPIVRMFCALVLS